MAIITLYPYDNNLIQKYVINSDAILVELMSDQRAFSVSLPDLLVTDAELTFKNLGSNTVTLQSINGQPIDFTGTFSHNLTSGKSLTFISNKRNRWITL